MNIVVDIFTGGDLVDGLALHCTEYGLVPDAQLAHITRQMVAAIQHVHSLQIVHRDIKGENYLLDVRDIGDPRCHVALADFGTAIRLEPGNKLTGKVGTPAFWSPEACSGKYDFLVDIWALGVTAYILVAGCLPFNGEEEICAPSPDPASASSIKSRARAAGASRACADFLDACLTQNVANRPPASEAAKLQWMNTPPPKPRVVRTKVSVGGILCGILGALGSCLGSCAAGVCSVFGHCLDKAVEKSDQNLDRKRGLE